jgi:hypothetical protein
VNGTHWNYGSEGRGFKSLRARQPNQALANCPVDLDQSSLVSRHEPQKYGPLGLMARNRKAFPGMEEFGILILARSRIFLFFGGQLAAITRPMAYVPKLRRAAADGARRATILGKVRHFLPTRDYWLLCGRQRPNSQGQRPRKADHFD